MSVLTREIRRRVRMVGQAPNLQLPAPWNASSAQARWQQVYTQIQAEGTQGLLSPSAVQDNIAQAYAQFTSGLSSLAASTQGTPTQQPLLLAGVPSALGGSSIEMFAAAMQSSTLAQNTIYGAVQMVQGIGADVAMFSQGVQTGNASEIAAGAQALIGGVTSLVALIVGGSAATGVGAAVGAVVGAAIEIGAEVLSAFHLIGGGGGTKVGDATCSGNGFTSSQGTTGGILPPNAPNGSSMLQAGLLNPGANGEGVCVSGSLYSPGSAFWRTFPSASNLADAAWFSQSWPSSLMPGFVSFEWPSGPAAAQWSTYNKAEWRPIDNAFHRYRWLECEWQLSYQLENGGGQGVSLSKLDAETGAAAVGFLQAYFAAWKRNQEFALNGLQPAADWQVLIQLASSWNRAHAPGKTFTFQAAPGCTTSTNCFPGGAQGQGTNPQDVTGGYSYVSLLAGDLISNSQVPAGGLTINTGPRYAPALVFATKTPIGTKIVLGSSLAILLGAGGAAGYGAATGQGAGYLFGVAGDALGAYGGRALGYLGAGERRRKKRRR